MAIVSDSYSVSKVATVMVVNYRATGPDGSGNWAFNLRRAFTSFDLSAAGIAAGTVESAQLILNCTAIVGGSCPVQLMSDSATGWGTTLDATHDDWISTRANVEDTLVVSSTGSGKTWNVNPNNLSYTGRTWFSLWNTDEGISAPYQTSATFSTKEAGTPANRPILRLTLRSGQVIFVQVM